MGRTRPCSICRKWFEPHPRTAKTQRACGRQECQRERHARACAKWRAANPDYDVERRLNDRLVVETPTTPAPPDSDPRTGLDWQVARDAMGLKAGIVAYQLTGLIVQWARDAMPPKNGGQRRIGDPLPRESARDATEPGGPAP